MSKKVPDSEDPERVFGETPYVTKTQGVKIMVWPVYDEERSRPYDSVFFYEYFIKIVNESNEVVQLINRHWTIGDGFERVEEVKGDGVVGHQPTLGPGETFHYSSYCPLRTPTGWMSGAFGMRNKADLRFEAKIDRFYLKNKMMLN
ncbi:MAG TPA: Co2+/Mg2+ efflux protein ApaG [Bdellovibrionota bacterium]|jgi:ApaG protein|nr:Co2+/Mg2+ efflux protein ApaG [Bdellovibrionota bacterium]